MGFNEVLQKINNFLNNLPTIIKNSPKDEKIAYYVVFAGIGLFVIGLVTMIIF